MLIEHPDFVLPAPEGPRVARVLQQGLMELSFTEHRRGCRSYALNRGLRLQENETQMHVEGPAFTATIEFDERHRVSNIKFSMGGGAGQQ